MFATRVTLFFLFVPPVWPRQDEAAFHFVSSSDGSASRSGSSPIRERVESPREVIRLAKVALPLARGRKSELSTSNSPGVEEPLDESKIGDDEKTCRSFKGITEISVSSSRIDGETSFSVPSSHSSDASLSEHFPFCDRAELGDEAEQDNRSSKSSSSSNLSMQSNSPSTELMSDTSWSSGKVEAAAPSPSPHWDCCHPCESFISVVATSAGRCWDLGFVSYLCALSWPISSSLLT
mmetsp:Transcript_29800/g.70858  ORF Transcript_29800/g.70858 Transcript_29800/m.70858 type:complete len:236 (+) Transcript_29800:1839-2546(+)